MKLVLTADLHLSADARVSYRFAFLDYIRENAKAWGVDAVCILGDVTDIKDRHSAPFVHQVAETFTRLADVVPVYVLVGNHDYIDIHHPFFSFLSNRQLYWMNQPTVCVFDRATVLMLPHSMGMQARPFDQHYALDYILMHETITGARASTGSELQGLDARLFSSLRCQRIYSGDIHKPQQIGPVVYIGSPYHVHFGDDFTPRFFILDTQTGKVESKQFNAPKRVVYHLHAVTELAQLEPRAGDHIKLKVDLPKYDTHGWRQLTRQVSQWAKEYNVTVYGVEPIVNRERAAYSPVRAMDDAAVIKQYCDAQRVRDTVLLEMGLGFLNE